MSGEFSGFPEIFRKISGPLCFSCSLAERIWNVGEAEAELGGRILLKLGIGCGSRLEAHGSEIQGLISGVRL